MSDKSGCFHCAKYQKSMWNSGRPWSLPYKKLREVTVADSMEAIMVLCTGKSLYNCLLSCVRWKSTLINNIIFFYTFIKHLARPKTSFWLALFYLAFIDDFNVISNYTQVIMNMSWTTWCLEFALPACFLVKTRMHRKPPGRHLVWG